jgi:sigma-E factor negative regulatory protein RseC
MLESEAIVVRIENGATFVEAQGSGGCGGGNCSTTCSTATLTRLFSQTPKALQVNNPIAAQVGERVVVGLAEGAFLKTALAVYLLPLSALLVGAGLGLFGAGHSDTRDLYAGLGGLAGLVLSALALKLFASKLSPIGAQPVILRRL